MKPNGCYLWSVYACISPVPDFSTTGLKRKVNWEDNTKCPGFGMTGHILKSYCCWTGNKIRTGTGPPEGLIDCRPAAFKAGPVALL